MRIEPPMALKDLPACVLETAESEPIGPMTVQQYFRMPETNRRESLVYGWAVREYGPTIDHQLSLFELIFALNDYVRARDLGVACTCDVVLDEAKRLVVQPDAMVLFRDRMQFRKGRLYAAPNLAIEVLSPKTKTRDRTLKLEWYRTYGVQEYWIVDGKKRQIEQIDFTAQPECAITLLGETDVIRSAVLTDFSFPVADVFKPVDRFVYRRTPDGELTCRPDAKAEWLTRYDTKKP